MSGLSLVLNSSSLPLSLSLWVPSSVWPEPSEGHVEQKFTTRFFDEKDKRKVLRRNEVYEDVNTKANVNKFDFLLNTFTKYCYILLSSSILRLNVILFVLRTKTTAKCRRHPTQSRSCVTHVVAYSYCHVFEFWDLLYQIGGLARSKCIDIFEVKSFEVDSSHMPLSSEVKSSRM